MDNYLVTILCMGNNYSLSYNNNFTKITSLSLAVPIPLTNVIRVSSRAMDRLK